MRWKLWLIALSFGFAYFFFSDDATAEDIIDELCRDQPDC